MAFETLKFEEKVFEGGQKAAVLTFSRPKAMNALNAQVLGELDQALDEVAQGGFRCLVLTGEGKAFVAGADITEFKGASSTQAEEMSLKGQKLFSKLEKLELPVVAAVNGFALGGGLELALSCDFILASEKAKWGLPEVGLGLLPGYGGTQRLSLKTNPSIAKRVALTGEMFGAAQAKEWGLFQEVFPEDQFMELVLKVVEGLCLKAPIAIRMTKASIQAGVELGVEEGFTVEARAFGEVFKTEDKTEGVSAFLEKRKAIFKGC